MQVHRRVDEEQAGEPARDTGERPDERADGSPVSPAATVLDLQRGAGNSAVVRYLQERGALSRPGDAQEQEADRVARSVMGPGPGTPRATVSPSTAPDSPSGELDAAVEALGAGEPLSGPLRSVMEPRFGENFGDVRVHTGQAPERANAALQAEAFTYGQDIYFGEGRAPGADALTAHELTHVVQQRRAGGGSMAAKRIQASFTASYPVTLGAFEIDLQTREGAIATPPTFSGLDGYIRFVPNSDAPNSNTIVFIQIVKLTDAGGADVDPASMPAAQAPRGHLGDPGVRTEADAAGGVEGGYFTDVHHRPNAGAPGATQGSPLSPRYNFQPAAPGAVGAAGQTQQPAQYGGGRGGVAGQTPGFKRSPDPADIRSAALFDTPGTTSNVANLDFAFESVARGEDTMVTYGVVKWGFGLRAGRVVNEHLEALDGASATFSEALERHRDFYVHEPVTFYFPFDGDALEPGEPAKIDEFMDYLGRNPTVRMSLQGFADVRGGGSERNRRLSRRRAETVHTELLAKGIDAGRIDPITIGPNVPASATTDAGTGDQGGDPAVGGDQDREANRRFNRRVVLTFTQTASTPVGGAGP